jgi:hypothetical protein
MRRLAAALAILAASGAAPAFAQAAPAPRPAPPAAPTKPAPVDPERLAIAEEVVAIAFPVEKRQEMMSRLTDSVMAQVRAAASPGGEPADPGAQAILKRYFDRVRAEGERLNALAAPDLFRAAARAYARMFTRDELVQIRAFVATPAGAKYVQRSPDLISDPDVARVNTAHFERVFETIDPIRAEFQRELMTYFTNHPHARR